MKTYRNLNTIKQRETLGRRFSLAGLGVLLIGLLASFVPTWYPEDAVPTGAVAQFLQTYWVYISFTALPLGFLLASLGSYHINRFAARRWPGSKQFARPDELITRSLKGMDDKYAFFVWSLPTHYVLAGPFGLLALVVRSDRGRIFVNEDRWREPFNVFRFFTIFAREGIGNPGRELEGEMAELRTLLETDDGALDDVPIDGAVIFVNPQVELELNSPTVTVMQTEQFKQFVRRKTRDSRIDNALLQKLTQHLVDNATYSDEGK